MAVEAGFDGGEIVGRLLLPASDEGAGATGAVGGPTSSAALKLKATSAASKARRQDAAGSASHRSRFRHVALEREVAAQLPNRPHHGAEPCLQGMQELDFTLLGVPANVAGK